jgi:hypothetical protein
MSACCGASSGIGKAFASRTFRPKIIFGSTDSLSYSQYALAWTILYRRFMISGVNRNAARRALRDICAIVHPTFLYRRWDDDSKKYRSYPSAGVRYAVCELDPTD